MLASRKSSIVIWIAVPLLLSLALLPRNILALGTWSSGYSDIAPPVPTITTYVVIVTVSFFAVILRTRRRYISAPMSICLIVLSFMTVFIWDGTAAQWSGLIVLAAGAMAWTIGRFVGSRLPSEPRATTIFLGAILLILLIQLAIAFAQRNGVLIPGWLTSEGRLAVAWTGRATGTLGHPANLSKIALLFLILVLPWTVTPRTVHRRLAWLIVCACVILGLVTISRSNILAMAAILFLWLLAAPGKLSLVQRLSGLLVMLFAGIFLTGDVVLRFLDDPEGGARPALFSAGIAQILRDPAVGTGLNSYIDVVAPFSSETALGYPVHNAFVLAIAEMGIVAGVLFFVPMLHLTADAVRNMRHYDALYSCRAFLCSAPGLVLVLWTGWGLLNSQYLILWFFLGGIYRSSILYGRDIISRPTEEPLSHVDPRVAGKNPRGTIGTHY